jgi:hypothetical protein
MRKRIISAIFMTMAACSLIGFSQDKTPTASFNAELHDFGKINEADGPVTHQFTFTNTGGEPLIIKNVTASCGCTTPNWSKEPVLPGAKGFITVTFNPQGRPGHFEKNITVNSNGEPGQQVLKISGEVAPAAPKPQSLEEQFPFNMNGLRMKSSQILFNNVSPMKTATQTVEYYNSTDQPIKVAFTEVPKHITVRIDPEIIQPKSKARVAVTYDAAGKGDWGFVVDRIKVTINDDKTNVDNKGDRARGVNLISVTANILDDMSLLTDEQRKNAPKIEFENVNFNFDTIKLGDKIDHEYKFKNSGKSDLMIRKVAPSCGCTTVSMKTNLLKPGESGSIPITFNSMGKPGSQQKAITVITNDPNNSQVRLWVKGFVKQ